MPMTMVRVAAEAPTTRVARAPYRIAVSMSRPRLSVPSTKPSWPGGVNGIQTISKGSLARSMGAKRAEKRITEKIANPAVAAQLRTYMRRNSTKGCSIRSGATSLPRAAAPSARAPARACGSLMRCAPNGFSGPRSGRRGRSRG